MSNANSNGCEQSKHGKRGEHGIEGGVGTMAIGSDPHGQGHQVTQAVRYGGEVVVRGNARDVALTAVVNVIRNGFFII